MKKLILTLAALSGFFITQNAQATCSNYTSYVDGQTLTSSSLNSLQSNYTNCINGILDGDIFTGAINLHSGSDLNIFSDTGSTLKFSIDGVTGNTGIASGAKFFLDGANLLGNTYWIESAADQASLFVGGSELLRQSTTLSRFFQALSVDSTNKLYLDGGGNTYFQETSADDLILKVGGANAIEATTTQLLMETAAADTTASAANAVITAVTGRLQRSTSSIKYKTNVINLAVDSSKIYKLRPVSYNDKRENSDDGKKINGKIFHKKSYFGLIAEEVDPIIPELVGHNTVNGEAEYVYYDRLSVLLLAELKKSNQRITVLENRLAAAGIQ